MQVTITVKSDAQICWIYLYQVFCIVSKCNGLSCFLTMTFSLRYHKRTKYGWITKLMNYLLSCKADGLVWREREEKKHIVLAELQVLIKIAGQDVIWLKCIIHLNRSSVFRWRIYWLIYNFLFFFSNSYHSLSSLSIQHHAVGISGDLEGSSYHLATQSCILTL